MSDRDIVAPAGAPVWAFAYWPLHVRIQSTLEDASEKQRADLVRRAGS